MLVILSSGWPRLQRRQRSPTQANWYIIRGYYVNIQDRYCGIDNGSRESTDQSFSFWLVGRLPMMQKIDINHLLSFRTTITTSDIDANSVHIVNASPSNRTLESTLTR